MQKYKVTENNIGQRLDVFLALKTGRSRNFWQDQIKAGLVSVGSQSIKSSLILDLGQIVQIKAEPEQIQQYAPPALTIIYEDNDMVVINKPAGLLTHATAKSHEATVADFAATKSSDPEPVRPGIVHRLDRDTSGLLIIAKTAAAKTYLQDLFKGRQISKTYIALVLGRLRLSEAVINLPVGRSTSSPSKKSVAPGGKSASTFYRVLGEYPGYSLVEAKPATGRTHQLRAHFSYLGHPLAGDTLYGPKARPQGLERQFLHASALELVAPNGQKLSLQSPLPPELQRFLDGVGQSVN